MLNKEELPFTAVAGILAGSIVGMQLGCWAGSGAVIFKGLVIVLYGLLFWGQEGSIQLRSLKKSRTEFFPTSTCVGVGEPRGWMQPDVRCSEMFGPSFISDCGE